MEFRGKVISLDDVKITKKSGEDFEKKVITLEEVEGKYPNSISLDLIWDVLQYINDVKVWDVVNVKINSRSVEYNGKRFNNLRAWSLQKEKGVVESNDDASLPF